MYHYHFFGAQLFYTVYTGAQPGSNDWGHILPYINVRIYYLSGAPPLVGAERTGNFLAENTCQFTGYGISAPF